MQGRASVARLVHTQKVAGSIPAPATIYGSWGGRPALGWGEGGKEFFTTVM